MKPDRRIENACRLATCLFICAAALLTADVWAQTTLPKAPTVGGTAATTSDPVGYMVAAIRYLIVIAFVLIVLFAMGSFGGGLVSELNQARQRGEWGRFSIYVGGGLLVLLIVLFAGWWGGTIITGYLT